MTSSVEALASGRQVVLLPFTTSDITDTYIGWLNDAEVMRYSNQRFRRHDYASCEAYAQGFVGSDNLFLSVKAKDENKAVGTMTAYVSRVHGTADIGIMIGDRRCWGHGYGLESWQLLMTWLFEARKLRKVTGGTLRCNIGMVRIMERSGMTLEGVRVGQELVNGVPQDVLYFGRFAVR